jgi:hypothetical protein
MVLECTPSPYCKLAPDSLSKQTSLSKKKHQMGWFFVHMDVGFDQGSKRNLNDLTYCGAKLLMKCRSLPFPFKLRRRSEHFPREKRGREQEEEEEEEEESNSKHKLLQQQEQHVTTAKIASNNGKDSK